MTTKRPKRLALVFFLLGQCLFGVVFLEVGLRAYAVWSDRVRGATFHEAYGWKPVASIRKGGAPWGATAPVTTNSHGWRDIERDYRRNPERPRIVALGDSFTFGWGIDDGERFTEVMEHMSPNLEVINLGMHGYGTDQEVLVFENEGSRYEPELVLLSVFLGNDLDDLRYQRLYGWPKPYFQPRDDGFVLLSPERTWDVRLRIASYLAEVSFQIFERGRPRSVEAPIWSGRDTMPLFRWLVQRLSNEVSGVGGRLLAVLIYPQEELETGRSQRDELVLSMFEEQGIAVVDTFEAFRAAVARGDDLHLPEDPHWSASGNRLAAELILSKIRESGWLDSQPPQGPATGQEARSDTWRTAP